MAVGPAVPRLSWLASPAVGAAGASSGRAMSPRERAVAAVARVTGLSEREVSARLAAGWSLAQVAQSAGVSRARAVGEIAAALGGQGTLPAVGVLALAEELAGRRTGGSGG